MEKKLIVKALKFFVDYRFNIVRTNHGDYLELLKEDDYNEYVKVLKKLGGKPKW